MSTAFTQYLTELQVLRDVSWSTVLIALVVIPTVALIIDYGRILFLRQRMPPGPFPWPIFGNVFQFPKEKPWYIFEEWSQKYNDPVITVWIGRSPTVVLNDAWTASELMDKRANIYSSRPRLPVPGIVMGGESWAQTMLPYGDKWRRQRKLTHAAVGAQAVRGHRDFQSDESMLLLKEINEDNDDFVMSIERYSCSVVSIIGWGRRIKTKTDPIVERALAMMHQAAQIFVPGDYWVETIPELRFLPSWLYAFPTQVRTGRQMMAKYWYALTQEGAENSPDDCFSSYLLKNAGDVLSLEEVGGLTGNLIGGGVDTTTSTMLSFILACVAFPEAFVEARKELDRVVGQDRLPDWSDEAQMPYCRAMIREVLRWRSVAVLGGIPHAPTRDDEYRGYFVPAGTSIMGNIWAIHRHPREFPEPDVFRPARYLAENRLPYPNERGYNTFGWGRRQCPGQPLAEQGLFLSLTRLIWAFEIRPALDSNGKEEKVDIFAYTNGENMRPQPFRARFIPRNEKILKTMQQSARDAEERLGKYDGETKIFVQDFFKNSHI